MISLLLAVLLVVFLCANWLPLFLVGDGNWSRLGGAFTTVDWVSTSLHALLVGIFAGLVGMRFGMATFYSTKPPLNLIGAWLALSALIPAPLLAQTFALTSQMTDGTIRPLLLPLGHCLLILPITFVLGYRIVSTDGNARYSMMTNLGFGPSQTVHSLMWSQYRNPCLLGITLGFFISFNESTIAGSVGGSTAYFGTVMNNLALGSAGGGALYLGSAFQLVSFMLAVLLVMDKSMLASRRSLAA